MIIFGHGNGSGFVVPATFVMFYTSTIAGIVMDDVNPIGPFLYTVPDVY